MKIGTEDGPYLKRYGFERGMQRIAELGFECLDYAIFCNTEQPLFQLDDKGFESELLRQRKFIESLGLIISQTHGPWRYPPQDNTEEERAERFEKMSRSIVGTAVLGSKYMVIHPIMPFGWNEDIHGKEAWDMNIEFMGRLAEVGRQNDVIVCLENMPFRWQCTSSPEAIRKIVETIDNPYLKVCLDTGHSLVLGVQPANAVRQIGAKYLHTLHVHDNNGENDYHWLPFTGMVNWDEFAKALQEINYQGVLSLETGIPASIPDELAPLQQQSLVQMAKRLAGRL